MKNKIKFIKNKSIRIKNINKDIILINLDNLKIFRYNSVGKEILSFVNGNRSTEDIIEKLHKLHKNQTKKFDKDIKLFLNSLLKNKIIKPIK